MTIKTLNDVGSDILIQESFRGLSLPSGWSEPGVSPTYSEKGVETLNGVPEISIPGFSALADAGQINVRVTSAGMSKFDDDASSVNFSQGIDRITNGYIFAGKRGAGGAGGFAFHRASDEELRLKTHNGDTSVNVSSHTAIYGDTKLLTFTHDGTNKAVYINGSLIDTNAISGSMPSDPFDTFVLGGDHNGVNRFGTGSLYLSDLVIADTPVSIPIIPKFETLWFGDSFTANSFAPAGTALLDARAPILLQSLFWENFRSNITITGAGYSGNTVCDTNSGGSGDLSFVIDGDIASAPDAKIFILDALNNDASGATIGDAATANTVLNAITGTLANLKLYMDKTKAAGFSRFILNLPGALAQNDTKDGDWQQHVLVTQLALQAQQEWLALNSGMDVVIFDQYGVLGANFLGTFDRDNWNYQGALDNHGNDYNGTGPIAPLGGVYRDRHPSALGEAGRANGIFGLITGIETSGLVPALVGSMIG